ncbi:MAG: hypothetical protein SCALA702_11480 [Melioribacteraceae bacterium]|nr:MAG: hypothetical protein SCALA702_11480 [Melioribacteraceae bacterium]
MIVYIDENLAPQLAKGFDILQEPLNFKSMEALEIKSIRNEFGQGVADEDWIPLAGQKKACVITQDFNIRRIRHQRLLCEEYNLGMFYFRPPSRKGYSYWDMVKLLVKCWEDISKIALTQKRPFSYKLSAKGKLEEL